ncbi:MAG: vitamin K epoxide reductase family protein [Chitinophagaceae bacterium]|nr:vitamin K epoxide reductase family protein [Chitinophagaceae bacterium]
MQNKNLLYAGVVLFIGLMTFMFIDNAGAVNILEATIIIVIKLLGLGITVLLLIYEIDKTNSFVKNICTAGKQTNCDAVLNSKAGKILGMGWGEVGFFYFAATTLFLLLPGLAFTNKLPWLAIAGTLAAPYILFSIYYQWRVVKQWCPLPCCTGSIGYGINLGNSLLSNNRNSKSFLQIQMYYCLLQVAYCLLSWLGIF